MSILKLMRDRQMYKYGQRVVAEQEEEQEIPEVLEQTMMGQTQIVVEMMEVIEGLLSGVLQLEM
jgi:hypothetical protein